MVLGRRKVLLGKPGPDLREGFRTKRRSRTTADGDAGTTPAEAMGWGCYGTKQGWPPLPSTRGLSVLIRRVLLRVLFLVAHSLKVVGASDRGVGFSYGPPPFRGLPPAWGLGTLCPSNSSRSPRSIWSPRNSAVVHKASPGDLQLGYVWLLRTSRCFSPAFVRNVNLISVRDRKPTLL